MKTLSDSSWHETWGTTGYTNKRKIKEAGLIKLSLSFVAPTCPSYEAVPELAGNRLSLFSMSLIVFSQKPREGTGTIAIVLADRWRAQETKLSWPSRKTHWIFWGWYQPLVGWYFLKISPRLSMQFLEKYLNCKLPGTIFLCCVFTAFAILTFRTATVMAMLYCTAEPGSY